MFIFKIGSRVSLNIPVNTNTLRSELKFLSNPYGYSNIPFAIRVKDIFTFLKNALIIWDLCKNLTGKKFLGKKPGNKN